MPVWGRQAKGDQRDRAAERRWRGPHGPEHLQEEASDTEPGHVLSITQRKEQAKGTNLSVKEIKRK